MGGGNSACCWDARPATQTPPLGYVPLRGLSAKRHCHRCVRRPEGARPHARPPLKKTVCGACGRAHRTWYDRRTRRSRDLPCGDTRIYLDLEVRRVACQGCGTVKREQLDFLADNPFYTKRFAYHVGRRCRASTIKDVAKELHLDWDTVKELEKQYMREQLRRAGTPRPGSSESTRSP